MRAGSVCEERAGVRERRERGERGEVEDEGQVEVRERGKGAAWCWKRASSIV
jgi:hypothetical protein